MPNQLKHLVFQVTFRRKTELHYASIDEMRKFPVHEEHLTEVDQKLVLYEYNPGAPFSEESLIEFLIKKLKVKYKAYSVIYLGKKIDELTLKQ